MLPRSTLNSHLFAKGRTAVVGRHSHARTGIQKIFPNTIKTRSLAPSRPASLNPVLAVGCAKASCLSGNSINPRVRYFCSIPVVIMVAMMAVVSSTPVIRGVSGARVIIRIRLRIVVVRPPVVPVRIIIIARRIGIIAARKSKTDSPNAGKSGGDLSVGTLPWNKSQSA